MHMLNNADESSGSNFLWGLLSFVFPMVGLVLAIVWWRDRHSNAKACLIGMLIPVALLGVAMIGSLIFGLAAASGSF